MTKRRHSLFDKLLTVTLVILLSAQVLAAIRPGGAASVYVTEWMEKKRIAGVRDSLWVPIANDVSVLSGSRDLDLAIIELGDYECPYCRRQHDEMKEFLDSLPGVFVGYVHTPLAFHPRAEGAARAAICAEEQGRFRELHYRFFETDGWKADTGWVREAEAAGINDTVAFSACLHSPRTDARLARDALVGQLLGSRGTPTMVGREDIRFGVVPTDELLTLAGF